MAYTGTVVVVPTRNRSAIAMNAIRSVLDQPGENVAVMVSDNSTLETERKALANFCSALGEARVRYVCPPEPLPMAAHWQWAIEQALAVYSASHFTYLTDRMMFRSGALAEALNLAALYPDKIISFNIDRINDHLRPIRVEQYPATQKLLELETIDLSRLLSQAVFHAGLPRMLNCIVPREVFGRMQQRFGDVFSSIAPDFRFCCRCFESEETILYYDKSLLFHYAQDRSNGATVSRGEVSQDNVDFAANLPVDNSRRNYATPIPQLITAVNAVFNEYLVFKQESGSPRFFAVDLEKYLRANAEEVRQFEDGKLRDEMMDLLVGHGYRGSGELRESRGASERVAQGIGFKKRLGFRLKRAATSSSTTEAWLFAARTFGIEPPGENSFEFATLEDAIDYAKNMSRGNIRSHAAQPPLLPSRELPTSQLGLPSSHDELPPSTREARTIASATNGTTGRQSQNQFARVRRALVSLTPVSLRRALHEKKNQSRLATLLRTKKNFRAARTTAARTTETDKPEARKTTNAPEGINLIGYIRADMGLGVAARGLAAAFNAAEIPFNVINMAHGNTSSHTDLSWSHKESLDSRYDITVVSVNPDNSFYLRTQISPEILGNRYVIANWYWELSEMPDEWLAEFEYTDEVWAATNFIRDAMSRKAPVPVVRVPPVVQLSHGLRSSKSDLGLPENRFLFLAMFDTKSVLERKNPLGVLRAFKSAFARDDASVGLVLKFNNPDYDQPVLRELREELAGCKNVFLIDRLLTRDELTSLIDECDCFVSLHRSEGFGLGPAEAMSLGKPAIVTNWSGNTDYMTADNCIAIDYELVQLGRDYGPYKAHQRWAEPDVEQAAHWMKRIVAEPELARQIGLRGQQTIQSEFSPQAVGKIVRARLQEIRGTR
jgi:glycosyltransferase involved in cell wall biosynthesis